jgi:hypothetical protein
MHFPGWTPDAFRSAMDLEHSFGPAYARGTARHHRRRAHPGYSLA